jgi:hypothetical protein
MVDCGDDERQGEGSARSLRVSVATWPASCRQLASQNISSPQGRRWTVSALYESLAGPTLSIRSPVRYLTAPEHQAGQRDTGHLRPDDRERREPASARRTEPVSCVFKTNAISGCNPRIEERERCAPAVFMTVVHALYSLQRYKVERGRQPRPHCSSNHHWTMMGSSPVKLHPPLLLPHPYILPQNPSRGPQCPSSSFCFNPSFSPPSSPTSPMPRLPS